MLGLIAGLWTRRWQSLGLAVAALSVVWGCLIAVGAADDPVDVLGAVGLGAANALVGVAVGAGLRLAATGLIRMRPSA